MKKLTLFVLLASAIGVSIYLLMSFRRADSQNGSLSAGQGQPNPKPRELLQGNSSFKDKSGLANNPIIITNLPEHIQALLERASYDLDWGVARKLTPADKDILLQLYRNEPTIVKKQGLTMALGFIGDEEIVEVFKHALSDQYAGRKLTTGNGDTGSNEEIVMHRTVEALGFLANKSDSAFELLKKGFEPKFWKNYCMFMPASGPDFYGSLTGRSIQAIGWSGRSDVTNILEALKPLPLVNDLDNSMMRDSFIGAVVDAAFYNDEISQRGLQGFKYLYLDLDSRLERLHEWRKSPTGVEWDNWYSKRMKE